jgi:hypothetical protein
MVVILESKFVDLSAYAENHGLCLWGSIDKRIFQIFHSEFIL